MILALQLALGAISGWLAYTSYAPIGWWPAGILGITGLFVALSIGRPTLWRGAAIGFIHGLVMYLFALPWIGELVGAVPYIALAISCAIYALITGAGGAAMARWPLGFLAFPFLYVAVEHLRSSFPFGGFAWVRLAWGQIDGPLATLASWGGPVLVSFAAALAGTGLAAVILSPRVAGALTLLLVVAAGLISGVGQTRSLGDVNVAAIQGNVPRLGLDFNAQQRAVLNNHVRVTESLEGDPDLVFWPENSSDVNPFLDPQAAEAITRAVQSVDAPVLVGTITEDEHGYYNTMQVFDPDTGAGDFHRKVYLQPFGEYMPMRDFFALFSDYVELAGNFSPGDGNFTVAMDGTTIGVATCFEVIVDDAYRTAIEHGAQILTTPTNNATFGYSDMTYQQLAMSRLRAIETDRAVVVAATSGVSAIVHPDGSVSQHTEIFEPATLSENLPLKDTVTPAVRFGEIIEWVLTIIGVVLTLGAVITTRSRR
ncbi:apolipoprotein N-acyltransferase [Corynebacterium yudongzhengii]|uniref:Apolipoprotein N-acyltransferase n=1 Tax=Corynebacterium yudongzhengii TaxID=2080740 RepID=A0A2U1T8N0_9CORY|nr:apolipoprotein N-acyltransferase [Corynebacterium yudongzhengii]AWB81913.1 apolipoprotein N-acyltransferase [Corynebacterium yudongzhengii]PWC02305.1 apolipoprotein N-acyltransferase [Corynebacterium yudongzhengii]